MHQSATPSPSPGTQVKRQVGLDLPEREVFRHRFLVARESVRRVPGLRISAWRKTYIRNRARLRLSQRHRSLLVNHCKTISYVRFLFHDSSLVDPIRETHPIGYGILRKQLHVAK